VPALGTAGLRMACAGWWLAREQIEVLRARWWRRRRLGARSQRIGGRGGQRRTRRPLFSRIRVWFGCRTAGLRCVRAY